MTYVIEISGGVLVDFYTKDEETSKIIDRPEYELIDHDNEEAEENEQI